MRYPRGVGFRYPRWVSRGIGPLVPPFPATPPYTNCYGTVWNAAGVKQKGVTFTFYLIDPMQATDSWGEALAQTATSDVNGLLQITLLQNMKWRMIGPDGRLSISGPVGNWVDFVSVPLGGLTKLPEYKVQTF